MVMTARQEEGGGAMRQDNAWRDGAGCFSS